jgi:hypothetical protein
MRERFLLPAEMVNHECVISRTGDEDFVRATTWVEGHAISVTLPFSLLTPVKPPLPEEPPVGKVVLDSRGRVWQRTQGGRFSWDCVVSSLHEHEWEVVAAPCDGRGPVLLVPDPLAGEPIQLPWRDERSNTSLAVAAVHCGKGLIPSIQVTDRTFTVTYDFDDSAHAREFARAVWAAATQTDKAGTP